MDSDQSQWLLMYIHESQWILKKYGVSKRISMYPSGSPTIKIYLFRWPRFLIGQEYIYHAKAKVSNVEILNHSPASPQLIFC